MEKETLDKRGDAGIIRGEKTYTEGTIHHGIRNTDVQCT